MDITRNEALALAERYTEAYRSIVTELGATSIWNFIEKFNQVAVCRRRKGDTFSPNKIFSFMTCEVAAILTAIWWEQNTDGEFRIILQYCHDGMFVPHAIVALLNKKLDNISLLSAYELARTGTVDFGSAMFFHFINNGGLKDVADNSSPRVVEEVYSTYKFWLAKLILQNMR